MKKIATLLFLTLVFTNIQAQKDKVKGNKILTTEQKIVEGFHTIQLQNEFEVSIDEDSDHVVVIEADSNLQEFIQVFVRDSILTVKSSKEFKKAKALNIRIRYASNLKKIILSDDVVLKSKTPVKASNLVVETNGNAETSLTIEGESIQGIFNGKSKSNIHVTAKEVSYQVNEKAELKGTLTSEQLKIDLYQKGTAKIEGELTTLNVRADSNTEFFGERLISETTEVLAEGDSKCYLHTKEQLSVEAIDKSEIYALGNAKIDLKKFLNEASIFKKEEDYKPGFLK